MVGAAKSRKAGGERGRNEYHAAVQKNVKTPQNTNMSQSDSKIGRMLSGQVQTKFTVTYIVPQSITVFRAHFASMFDWSEEYIFFEANAFLDLHSRVINARIHIHCLDRCLTSLKGGKRESEYCSNAAQVQGEISIRSCTQMFGPHVSVRSRPTL